MCWGPCKDVSDVQAFLGMAGTCRMFIKDYAKITQLLTHLLWSKVLFEWGESQDLAMQEVKVSLSVCLVLRPIDYHLNAPVILGIDMYIVNGCWLLDLPRRS